MWLLLITALCAANVEKCFRIKDRDTCLRSVTSRSVYKGQRCGWCPNGPCDVNGNRCRPVGFLKKWNVEHEVKGKSDAGCTDLAGPGMQSDPQDSNRCRFNAMYAMDLTLEGCEQACEADDSCNAIYYQPNIRGPGVNMCGRHVCPLGKDSPFVSVPQMTGVYKLCEKEKTPEVLFSIEGTATLNGAMGVEVTLNRRAPTEQQKTLNADGAFAFDDQVYTGDRVDIEVTGTPSGVQCTLGGTYRAHMMPPSPITDLTVTCSPATSSSLVGKSEQIAVVEQSWSVDDVAVYLLALVGVGAVGYAAYSIFSSKLQVNMLWQPVTLNEFEEC